MRRAYTKYITSLLIFGSNGIIASYIALSGSEIVMTRTILGCLFLFLILKISKSGVSFKELKKQLPFMLGSGLSMGLSWIFLFEAFKLIGVSIASLTYSCGPVFVIAFSPIFLHERIKPGKVLALFIVIAGMIFVNSTNLSFSGVSVGFIYGVLSAVLYASMVILGKNVKDIGGLQTTAIQTFFAFLIVAPYALATHQGAIHLTNEGIIAIFVLGIVNTGLGCYLYFSSIRKLPAQTVAICGYLEPLSAVFFSVIFLNEKLNSLQLLGVVMIMGSALFTELFYSRKNKVIAAALSEETD